jgi:phospholipid/cholesterol/gamma-HCH transport system substrate-binding protein
MARRHGRFSRATLVKVIAFTIASAIFTVGLAIKIGNLQLFKPEYTLHAVFADASGVFKGDAVKLAGVDVGSVDGAKITNGRAEVTFTVKKKVRLTTDSVVALRWRNVLGLRFLYVYPGDGRGRVLQNGDTIPLTHTQDAADLGQFLNELGPILKAIDPNKANAFLDAMNTALSGNELAVRSLLGNGATLATRLASMDKQIQTLIDSSDTVMSTYAGQRQAIGDILDRLDHLGSQLHSMTPDLNSFITNFTDVQSKLDDLEQTNKSSIDFDLRALQSVVDLLSRNKGNLDQTLCTLPAGVTPYFQTTSWGEWFNVRVVKFKIADNNSKTLFSDAESSHLRPPVALPTPYTCGEGSPFKATTSKRSGGHGKASASGGRGGSSSGANGETGGFQDLGGFLKTVVGGGSNG